MSGERGYAWAYEALLLVLALACGLFGYGLPGTSVDVGWKPSAKPEDGLRIVTWNLGGSAGGGGRRFDDEQLDAVAASLRYIDPDIVVVQELRGRGQLRRLANALGSETSVAFDQGIDGRGVGAIATSGGLQKLDPPRGANGAPLSVRFVMEDGRKLHICGLHAHPWSASSRNEAIGRSVDLLEDEGERYGVLLGDLNLDLDRGKRQDLFTDDEHLDIQTYNYAAKRLFDAGLGGGPTAEPDRRLDYIFVSGSLEVLTCAPFLDQRRGDMDHHPVVADVAFR